MYHFHCLHRWPCWHLLLGGICSLVGSVGLFGHRAGSCSCTRHHDLSSLRASTSLWLPMRQQPGVNNTMHCGTSAPSFTITP